LRTEKAKQTEQLVDLMKEVPKYEISDFGKIAFEIFNSNTRPLDEIAIEIY
jgi:hypothetical protein